MIQCKDCEFCELGEGGQVHLKCNPFTNIKESECLLKLQLMRLDLMTQAYMMTIAEYKKIAPLQEKLYRRMSREVDEMDEADRWKYEGEDEEKPPEKGKGGGKDEEEPPPDDRL